MKMETKMNESHTYTYIQESRKIQKKYSKKKNKQILKTIIQENFSQIRLKPMY